MASPSVVQSFWNFEQRTAVSLSCDVQNFKITGQLRNTLWANETSRDLSLRYVSDGYTILHKGWRAVNMHQYIGSGLLQDGRSSLPELIVMTTNGNIFRVTGPLCGEFTGHRWIPRTKGQWRGALMFSLICAWTNSWANNGYAGDLRRYRAHYDVIIMNGDLISCRPKHNDIWKTWQIHSDMSSVK